MKNYIRLKKELSAKTRKNINDLKSIDDFMVPEIKDSKGRTLFKERLVSSLKLKKTLTFINDIISAELHLESLIKTGNKSFKIKVKNLGSSPCYNAKCILYKQETNGLVKETNSDNFTIGIDEEKTIILSTKIDIAGVYYAVVHDPIMDSFPFANIDNLLKNQLPDPSSANLGWSTHSPIGNNSNSNLLWEKISFPVGYDNLLNPTQFINVISPSNLNQSSELKYKLTIPDFLKSSIKKNKVSIRFGCSCLLTGIMGPSLFEGKIRLKLANNSSEHLLKSIDNLMTIPKDKGGKNNFFNEKLDISTNEIDFFIQAIKKSNVTSNGTPNILLKNKKLLFSNVNLYFEHRQMCRFPKIKIT